jgi:hypothetical protein
MATAALITGIVMASLDASGEFEQKIIPLIDPKEKADKRAARAAAGITARSETALTGKSLSRQAKGSPGSPGTALSGEG